MNNLSINDLVVKGNSILNQEDLNLDNYTTDQKLSDLSVLLVYKAMLDERFAKKIKEFQDSIDEQSFTGTAKVCDRKVTFKVKEVVTAKAVGLTNEELKKQYNIADSIISVDTKTIATLKKDALEEAVKNSIPEILDAIRDGKLTFSKSNTKVVDVK